MWPIQNSRIQPTLHVPNSLYRKITEVLPILCVDLVIRSRGKYFLVKRKREPVKGHWWVPGGRVLKGETITQAAKRKAQEELGISIEILRVLGYYEDYFKSGYGRDSKHTVSIVVLAKPTTLAIQLDHQSSDWKLSQALPKDFKVVPFNS
jgi:colanic acid biosynthesis protein WcaH